MKQRSIVFYILSVTILSVVILIGMASVLIYQTLTHTISESQKKLLAERSSSIHASLQRKYDRLVQTGMPESYESDFQQQILRELESIHSKSESADGVLKITDSTEKIILPSSSTLAKTYELHDMKNNDSCSVIFLERDTLSIHVRTFEPWHWHIIYELSLAKKYADRTNFFTEFFPLMCLILVSILGLMIILLKRILQPVVVLNAATKQIALGSLSVEIPTRGVGELGELATNFKTMQESIITTIHQLQTSEKLLQESLDLLPIPLLIANSDGLPTFVNTDFSHTFGYEQSEIGVVEPWLQTVCRSGEWINEIGNVYREGTVHLRSKSGDERVIDFSIQPIESRTIYLFNDSTEKFENQKKTENLKEQLHQSQKMEAVGQLAGGVAHDFNNALGGIIGATELLKIGNLTPEEQREYLDLILTAGERAGDLTKKLLLFSRKGNKASSAVDCAKIVNETASLLKHTINKNITVSVDNRSTFASIIGDDSLLQNAFMNMGINASHAMPNGGELTFTLINLELDAEYCEISPFEIKPGGYLEIAIRDTGTGMSPEIQSRIFEPFFTTKEAGKGTGLGMAAVYGTVQEHGGAITVYSEVGTGTVFHIYLPVTMETATATNHPEEISQGTGTILVIDDEELIRITASALLVSLGYKVILATNGLEGVNTFSEAKNEIDLIILDMIMPVMGGREAFTKLREIDSTIPIIIASGFAKEEDMESLKKEGVNGFLNKPFRKTELAGIITSILTKELL